MKQIFYNERTQSFLLQTGNASYALAISDNMRLPVHLYFGAPLGGTEDLPEIGDIRCYPGRKCRNAVSLQEYPAFCAAIYTDSCLQAIHASGARNTRLRYHSFRITKTENAETLELLLMDESHLLDVSLFYTVYSDSALLDRKAVIRNRAETPVTLTRIFSASLPLTYCDTPYRITHLRGCWAGEGRPVETCLEAGKLVLESRTGLSGPDAMPFFAADDGNTTDWNGELVFGTLQWSGNWKIILERSETSDVIVSGGINDFDFQWILQSGESLETPVFSFGRTGSGFNGMFRRIHTHLRNHVEPEHTRGMVMPLLCNTYASFGSGPEMNEKNTVAAIRRAAEIGAELFVYDAGWQQALGDWTPHKEKFSGTIRPQADLAHSLGMKFGVWAELEAVDRESSVCRDHPDWIMQYPDRFPDADELDGCTENRLLLNLAKPEVREHLHDALDRLIGENDLDYFKIDMNQCFTHPGWAEAPGGEGREIYVEYVRSLYWIFGRIRQKYPHLIIENCACGNFRADWGFNRFCSRVNRSDNQEGLDILKLHEGFAFLHLPKSAGGGCHISDYYFYNFNHRKIPRRFQAFTGMMGSLGIGVNLLKADDEALECLRKYGELYKKLRNTVQNGIYQRLHSHFKHPYACYEYVLPDRSEAVLFLFGHSLQFNQRLPAIRPVRLDADARYKPIIYGGDEERGYDAQELPDRTGRFLMAVGLNIPLHGDLDCRIVFLKRERAVETAGIQQEIYKNKGGVQ